ncbi:MAG: mechanosensitive ion channel family protein, partial [Alphaproteobacteria bacterium]
QKVVSNFVSGFILLADKSIKPGDVIEVGEAYGAINRLGARYVSMITRDGKEFLIPNEDLITQTVINWSFSDRAVRVRLPIGIAYDCDPRKAMDLAVEAAMQEQRVLTHPEAKCLLVGFGDSSVDLELRIWIADPEGGVRNISSAVLLRVWDAFHENGITFPFPRRDVQLLPPLDG